MVAGELHRRDSRSSTKSWETNKTTQTTNDNNLDQNHQDDIPPLPPISALVESIQEINDKNLRVLRVVNPSTPLVNRAVDEFGFYLDTPDATSISYKTKSKKKTIQKREMEWIRVLGNWEVEVDRNKSKVLPFF
jgi:hypothetical protein